MKAILVGKGPSISYLQELDGYDIIALNNTISHCFRVDVMFMNDVEVLDLLAKEDMEKVTKLVLPQFPHKDRVPGSHFKDVIYKFPNLEHYEVHRLHNEPENRDKYCHLGIPYSVGITAMQWLAKEGYKEVILCGIDATGDYHPSFIYKDDEEKPINHACHAESSSWYIHNYNIILQIAASAGITLRSFNNA